MAVRYECEQYTGFISKGGDLLKEELTVEAAREKACTLPSCQGFCFRGEMTDATVEVTFKNKWDINIGKNPWVSFRVVRSKCDMASKLFHRFDQDGDGLLRKEDITELLSVTSAGQQVPDTEAVIESWKELRAGLVVRVLHAFQSSSKNSQELQPGMIGTVEKIDTDGDAYVIFSNIAQGQWVLKKNFDKLEAPGKFGIDFTLDQGLDEEQFKQLYQNSSDTERQYLMVFEPCQAPLREHDVVEYLGEDMYFSGQSFTKGMRGEVHAASSTTILTVHPFVANMGLIRGVKRSDVEPLRNVCPGCNGRGTLDCPSCDSEGSGTLNPEIKAQRAAAAATAEAAAIALPQRPLLQLLGGPDSEIKAIDRFFHALIDVSDAVGEEMLGSGGDATLGMSPEEIQQRARDLTATHMRRLQAENVHLLWLEHSSGDELPLSSLQRLVSDFLTLSRKNVEVVIDWALAKACSQGVEPAKRSLKEQFEKAASAAPAVMRATMLETMMKQVPSNVKMREQIEQEQVKMRPKLLEKALELYDSTDANLEQTCKAMIERMDRNHDGRVDQVEFEECAASILGEMFDPSAFCRKPLDS